jgi:hypothetical protein
MRTVQLPQPSEVSGRLPIVRGLANALALTLGTALIQTR